MVWSRSRSCSNREPFLTLPAGSVWLEHLIRAGRLRACRSIRRTCRTLDPVSGAVDVAGFPSMPISAAAVSGPSLTPPLFIALIGRPVGTVHRQLSQRLHLSSARVNRWCIRVRGAPPAATHSLVRQHPVLAGQSAGRCRTCGQRVSVMCPGGDRHRASCSRLRVLRTHAPQSVRVIFAAR
jgi:hypothetical protein